MSDFEMMMPRLPSGGDVMFESLFDLIPFAIYVMDTENYDLVYVNRSMRERTGAEPGNKCYQAIYGEDRPCFYCRKQELTDSKGLPKNETLTFEHFNPVDDRWYQLQEKALYWPDGRSVKYSIAVEVSSLKATQNRLAEAHAELSLKNRELERLSQEKSHFLGIAAHDLRNPMAAIYNFSELLAMDEVEADVKRFSGDKIRELSRDSLTLLNDLLDVSSIESGRLSLTLEPFDLEALCHDRIEMFRSTTAKQKRIPLEVVIDGAEWLGAVNADRQRLSQLLDNLLSNAIKFSSAGEQVMVSLRGLAEWVELEVADQGPGIPEEEQDKLFGLFQTLSARPTAGESSSGLGLAIVKKIVDAHRGEIRVVSRVGEGTAFTVALPR